MAAHALRWEADQASMPLPRWDVATGLSSAVPDQLVQSIDRCNPAAPVPSPSLPLLARDS
jgi:hypothetical protein